MTQCQISCAEQKFLRNGGSVFFCSVGTIEFYTKDGEQKERTEEDNVVFFGKIAEIAGEYLSKRLSVYVEGCPKTEKWDESGREQEADNESNRVKVD